MSPRWMAPARAPCSCRPSTRCGTRRRLKYASWPAPSTVSARFPAWGALSGGRSGDRLGRVRCAPIRAHRRCRCGLLAARRHLASAHRAATVEQRALVHDQARGGDAALHAAGRADVQPLTGGHVAGHPALDDDRGTRDLRVHHRALADGERIPRGDLPLTLALYPRCPLEHELAVDLGSLAQERVDPPGTGELARVPLPLEHRDLPRRNSVDRHDGYWDRAARPRPFVTIASEQRHELVPLGQQVRGRPAPEMRPRRVVLAIREVPRVWHPRDTGEQKRAPGLAPGVTSVRAYLAQESYSAQSPHAARDLLGERGVVVQIGPRGVKAVLVRARSRSISPRSSGGGRGRSWWRVRERRPLACAGVT